VCDYCDNERERLTKLAMKKRLPCVVCSSTDLAGVGTWIPDETKRLAAGGNSERAPIFSFSLCREHMSTNDENEKLIMQAVLRQVRTGRLRS
jgi:hypothetical protein